MIDINKNILHLYVRFFSKKRISKVQIKNQIFKCTTLKDLFVILGLKWPIFQFSKT